MTAAQPTAGSGGNGTVRLIPNGRYYFFLLAALVVMSLGLSKVVTLLFPPAVYDDIVACTELGDAARSGSFATMVATAERVYENARDPELKKLAEYAHRAALSRLQAGATPADKGQINWAGDLQAVYAQISSPAHMGGIIFLLSLLVGITGYLLLRRLVEPHLLSTLRPFRFLGIQPESTPEATVA